MGGQFFGIVQVIEEIPRIVRYSIGIRKLHADKTDSDARVLTHQLVGKCKVCHDAVDKPLVETVLGDFRHDTFNRILKDLCIFFIDSGRTEHQHRFRTRVFKIAGKVPVRQCFIKRRHNRA